MAAAKIIWGTMPRPRIAPSFRIMPDHSSTTGCFCIPSPATVPGEQSRNVLHRAGQGCGARDPESSLGNANSGPWQIHAHCFTPRQLGADACLKMNCLAFNCGHHQAIRHNMSMPRSDRLRPWYNHFGRKSTLVRGKARKAAMYGETKNPSMSNVVKDTCDALKDPGIQDTHSTIMDKSINAQITPAII